MREGRRCSFEVMCRQSVTGDHGRKQSSAREKKEGNNSHAQHSEHHVIQAASRPHGISILWLVSKRVNSPGVQT